MRTAILAEKMADRGHEVVLWSCTVNHAAKRQRASKTTIIPLRPIILSRCYMVAYIKRTYRPPA